MARNWLSHQGIKNVCAYDVMFIFHILVHVVLDVNKEKKLMEYEQLLVEAFAQSDKTIEKDVEKLIYSKIEEYQKMHCDAYNEFKKTEFYKKIKDKRELRGYHYEEGAEVYDIISGIGHEYSPIRNDVCMEHLYILFISSLDESDLQTNKVFVDSIVL